MSTSEGQHEIIDKGPKLRRFTAWARDVNVILKTDLPHPVTVGDGKKDKVWEEDTSTISLAANRDWTSKW